MTLSLFNWEIHYIETKKYMTHRNKKSPFSWYKDLFGSVVAIPFLFWLPDINWHSTFLFWKKCNILYFCNRSLTKRTLKRLRWQLFCDFFSKIQIFWDQGPRFLWFTCALFLKHLATWQSIPFNCYSDHLWHLTKIKTKHF